jgi:(2Fe-2S) ferredoxin
MGLQDYLRERGLQGTVRVTPCGCLGGCSYGPNMAVPPSPRVFLAMDLEKTKRLLARLGLDQPSSPRRQGEG